MTGTMKAAVIKEYNKPLAVYDVPIPKPTQHEILVKMLYSGICGTDHHVWKGEFAAVNPKDVIPGHEGVGEVVEVGNDVAHIKKGDIVGIPWLYSACGDCEHCFAGWETLCLEQKNAGCSQNGTLAEYAVADPQYVARIPDGVDLAHCAPVLCAGLTVYKGLKVTEAKAGQWVLISGLGGLGQLGIQFAKAMGFNVVGVDIFDDKLETAKRLGADLVFNGRTQDAPKLIKEQTDGGVHGAIVCAVSNIAFSQALKAVRRRGTMVCIGLPPGDFPLDIVNTVLDGITIRGSIVGTRLDMIEALRFFAQGKIHNEVQVDKLENVGKVMDLMDQGKLPGRVVFDFTK